jgi:hypothetical protein
MNKYLLLLLLVLACAPTVSAQEPIADNSFLIEEAYNQEAGVIQHINTFMRQRDGGWAYSYTQEIPVVSQKHQFSYTIPFAHVGNGVGRSFGDIALTYRYQLVSNRKVAVSPRFSLLLPTGDSRRGFGAGAPGYQFNLPVSMRHGKRFVTHWNAGMTLTPNAKNELDERANTSGYNLGQSIVFLAKPNFNVILETAFNRDQVVSGQHVKAWEKSLILNPGVRWAHNLTNGLQIVPGIAVPLGVGPSRGERGVFLYLSFEHPFKKIEE